MAAKRVSSEERKFVSLLASKLKKENYEFDGSELDSSFGEAVSNLPDSDLKSGLSKFQETHLKKLKSLLTSKKSQQESAAEKYSKFNFYKEQDIDKVIENIKACKSTSEKDDLFNRLWSCYPVLKDSQKIFSSLEVTDGIATTEKCIQKTVGCFNKKNVLECLGFLLRLFSTECEACFNDTKSSKCNKLASSMQRSIIVMNHRWLSCVTMATTTHNSGTALSQDESFEDLMAALLSLYTDLVLLSHEGNEDSEAFEQLASLVFMVIGHSPEHCMDAMLQLTKLNERLFSLLRCILERNKGQMSHKQYIKFICLARLALKLSSSQDKTLSILKIAENQTPPHGFVPFLLKSNKSLVEKLRITKKMSSSQLNTLLISDLCEDDVDTLLDIAMENSHKDSSAEENQESEEPTNDETGDNQLFFIDSMGGVEDAEDNEVEVEENKTRDTLLRRQIKTMIREAQEDSDSEGDPFDQVLPSIAKDLNEPASKDETEETESSPLLIKDGDVSLE